MFCARQKSHWNQWHHSNTPTKYCFHARILLGWTLNAQWSLWANKRIVLVFVLAFDLYFDQSIAKNIEQLLCAGLWINSSKKSSKASFSAWHLLQLVVVVKSKQKRHSPFITLTVLRAASYSYGFGSACDHWVIQYVPNRPLLHNYYFLK